MAGMPGLLAALLRVDRSLVRFLDKVNELREILIYGKIEANHVTLHADSPLMSFVNEQAANLPRKVGEVVFDVPETAYDAVLNFTYELDKTGNTQKDIWMIQAIIMFNIILAKIYYNRDGKLVDPYNSALWLKQIRFVADDDECKKIVDRFVKFFNDHHVVDDASLIELVNEIVPLSEYLPETIRILTPLLQNNDVKKATIKPAIDTHLGNQAQIICMEWDQKFMPVVWNFLRFWLTHTIRVSTDAYVPIYKETPMAGGDSDMVDTGMRKPPDRVYDVGPYIREINESLAELMKK